MSVSHSYTGYPLVQSHFHLLFSSNSVRLFFLMKKWNLIIIYQRFHPIPSNHPSIPSLSTSALSKTRKRTRTSFIRLYFLLIHLYQNLTDATHTHQPTNTNNNSSKQYMREEKKIRNPQSQSHSMLLIELRCGQPFEPIFISLIFRFISARYNFSFLLNCRLAVADDAQRTAQHSGSPTHASTAAASTLLHSTIRTFTIDSMLIYENKYVYTNSHTHTAHREDAGIIYINMLVINRDLTEIQKNNLRTEEREKEKNTH